jgi:CxxC-x17-CxxC domain-containing protein
MHAVVCGDCGKNTEVPFEPRGDRPVYCRECFAKHSPAGSRSRY